MTAYHDRRLAGHYDPHNTNTEAAPAPKRKAPAKTTPAKTTKRTTKRK